MIKVAINGFGRIGRAFTRCAFGNKNVQILAINDLKTPVDLAVHLLKYDSVYGKFEGEVKKLSPNSFSIDGKEIKMLQEADPAKLPWKELGIDVVIESTGVFTDKKGSSKHLDAGAKFVIVSAPCKGEGADEVKTIVLGVNEKTFDKSKDKVISNASCTTNCLAPIVKILNDKFGIKRGLMTTIHAYTNDQMIVDAAHQDLRRARAGALNIFPTTTGAAIAVGKVLPELKGKLDGISLRVPVPVGSIVDLAAELKNNTTKADLNAAVKEAASGQLKGIVQYTEEPIVSSDVIGNRHSAVFDALSTYVTDNNFVKVFAWYDNEFAYSQRLVDLVEYVMK